MNMLKRIYTPENRITVGWRLTTLKAQHWALLTHYHLFVAQFLYNPSAQLPMLPFGQWINNFSFVHTWCWVPSHLLAPNGPKTENNDKNLKIFGATVFNYSNLLHTEFSIHVQSLNCKGEFFWIFSVLYSTLLHLPPLRFQLCQRKLGSNPGQLRLRHRLSDALTTRLHLIHSLATSHPQLGYI